MADKITYEQLRVDCRFTFTTISGCSIHAKYGEHTRAEITGTVNSSDARAILSDISEEKLEIFSRNSNNVEEILFLGLIEHAELKEEGQYAVLSVKAVSYTWKMDIERKSRSFQNIAETYGDVARKIVREYGADMIWNVPDKPLKYPLVQYNESDYAFLKRILSHLGEGLTPVDSQAKIRFHAGMNQGSNLGEIDLNEFKYSLILLPNNRKEMQTSDKRQTGYRIENMDFAKVGDMMSIQGSTYYVMESSAEFVQNVLSCTCTVFPRQCFQVEHIPADTLKGLVLAGKVLETRQEMVKLHLDIDKEQTAEGAYEFPWKPIAGNLLYCMPEKGTKAALYFDKNEEDSISVIYSIRENGEECADLADYNNRYFTTDHQKRLYLKPSEMGLLNMENQNSEIAMKDSTVLNLKTNHKLSILAEGQVELKGKNVTLVTPIEGTLVRKDVIKPTVINMCNAFDAIGNTSNFAAAPQVAEKKRRRAVSGQQVEPYSLDGAVDNILSSIPADDMESPLMQAIAGSMPIVTRLGSSR